MMNAQMDQFLQMSAELTGFSRFELLGTGEAEAYLEATLKVVDGAIVDELLATHGGITSIGAERQRHIRQSLLGNPKLGPVARNIIKLWFSGTWYQLPRSWFDAYGGKTENSIFAVRPSSYAEGLLWKTIGANPPGARAPGYGSWAQPPTIPDPDAA